VEGTAQRLQGTHFRLCKNSSASGRNLSPTFALVIASLFLKNSRKEL